MNMRYLTVLFAAISVLFAAGCLVAMEDQGALITLPQSIFSNVLEPIEGESFDMWLPGYSQVDGDAAISLTKELLELLPEDIEDRYALCALKAFFEEKFSQEDLTPIWVTTHIVETVLNRVTIRDTVSATSFMMISIVLKGLRKSIQGLESKKSFVRGGVYSAYNAANLEKSIIKFWQESDQIPEDVRPMYKFAHTYAFSVFPLWVLKYLKKTEIAEDLSEFLAKGVFTIQSPTLEHLDRF